MTENYLRKYLNELPPMGQARWYQQQLVVARYLRADLLKRSGIRMDSSTTPAEIPEAEEIVHETVIRIRDALDDRYKWDGTSPATFSRFFARCLKTTMNSLRSAERGHRSNPPKLHDKVKVFRSTPYELSIETDETLARKQSRPVLATVIARTRIAGKIKNYADELPRYAAGKFTSAEIAEELGVESTTVDTFRKRLRKLLNDPET